MGVLGQVPSLGIVGAVVALFLVPPAAWSADPSQRIYNTKRVLGHEDNECVGVPECRSVASPRLVIDADQGEGLVVSCPQAYPFAWNWDTIQHEHLVVRVSGRTATALTFSATNVADAPGAVRVFVGCSAKPFDVAQTGVAQSRQGLPSRNRTFEGGRVR